MNVDFEWLIIVLEGRGNAEPCPQENEQSFVYRY